MPDHIFERLRNYFQGVADALAGNKDASAIFPNKPDAGATREDLLFHFLASHVPKRCEVIKGGFIFDDKGNESRQIDIIVTNDLTLQFKPASGSSEAGKSFNCIEGCYAAISVKTKLDKTSLEDCIENLASIPETPPLQLNPFVKAAEVMEEMPIRIAFAFEGVKPTVIQGHLEDYYSNSKIPQNRRLNMIVVNNAYVVVRTGSSGASTRDGHKIPPHTYYPQGWETVDIGGFSLLSLISQIQIVSNLGSHMFINFSRYLDLIPLYSKEEE